MSSSSPQAGQPAIRVAIVDDHRLVLEGIAATVSARGVDLGIDVVITEASWRAFISHERFPVDVAVLDLNLNDGIAIRTKVRALSTAGTRTIVMSSHTDASAIYRAINAGALAFVPKTDSADELVAAILSASTGAAHSSAQVTNALSQVESSHDPGLGSQELRALRLYAAGRSIREVARDMNTTDETVKSYIKRARRKYRDIGIDLGTKILLRRHAIREGWVTPE